MLTLFEFESKYHCAVEREVEEACLINWNLMSKWRITGKHCAHFFFTEKQMKYNI